MAIARRSKKKFRTARSAWTDIGKKRGISAKRVKRKAHTRTHWRFVLK